MSGKQRLPTGDPLRPSPGFSQRIYSPHSIAAIIAELGKQGVDPSDGLEGTGLSASQLASHRTKISYRQLDIVIRHALRLSSDPSIALNAGKRMHLTAYGMYGYALMSSTTHADAREFAARYIRVVGPFCDFSHSYRDRLVVATFEPLHWQKPTEAVHRFAVEFALSAHLTTLRDRYGPTFTFSHVALDYQASQDASAYHQLFGCPVLFGQPDSLYEYARNDGPAVLADPRSHAMAREMCEQLLCEVNHEGDIAAQIRRILIEQPGKYPNIEDVALRLGMHQRALRRRLEAEGTSYRDLVAELRMRLAIEYLRKTLMTNDEIAIRLGYSDAANFRHAFARWTGKHPSEFRGDTASRRRKRR